MHPTVCRYELRRCVNTYRKNTCRKDKNNWKVMITDSGHIIFVPIVSRIVYGNTITVLSRKMTYVCRLLFGTYTLFEKKKKLYYTRGENANERQ